MDKKDLENRNQIILLIDVYGELLTEKQKRILDYINEFTLKQGYPPSVREICNEVGLRSPSTVHCHIKRLRELGKL